MGFEREIMATETAYWFTLNSKPKKSEILSTHVNFIFGNLHISKIKLVWLVFLIENC